MKASKVSLVACIGLVALAAATQESSSLRVTYRNKSGETIVACYLVHSRNRFSEAHEHQLINESGCRWSIETGDIRSAVLRLELVSDGSHQSGVPRAGHSEEPKGRRRRRPWLAHDSQGSETYGQRRSKMYPQQADRKRRRPR